MTRETDPDFESWVARARAVPMAEAAERIGLQLKRNGHELTGPCLACGGTDRFNIRAQSNEWLCRGSAANKGKDGGRNPIDMVMHAGSMEFLAAVELLTGEAPPKGESKPVDESAARERREERKDREIAERKTQAAQTARKSNAAADLFEKGIPISGTDAEAYLRRRGIVLAPENRADLRFMRALEYRGYEDRDADSERALGEFPCMLAAIRIGGPDGEIIGCHRTYLKKDEPAKLVPPGDRVRNKAKKSFGNVKGGAIWFGPVRPCVAIGEGIETVLSWNQLGYGPDDLTVVSGVALGNLGGAATGSLPHPRKRGKTVWNGIPDPKATGIILPESVGQVIFLGDGDSDPVATRAIVLTGMRRYAAAGLTVSRHMAPAGSDFNDVLLAQSAGGAA